jgi:hypothetical protein
MRAWTATAAGQTSSAARSPWWTSGSLRVGRATPSATRSADCRPPPHSPQPCWGSGGHARRHERGAPRVQRAGPHVSRASKAAAVLLSSVTTTGRPAPSITATARGVSSPPVARHRAFPSASSAGGSAQGGGGNVVSGRADASLDGGVGSGRVRRGALGGAASRGAAPERRACITATPGACVR